MRDSATDSLQVQVMARKLFWTVVMLTYYSISILSIVMTLLVPFLLKRVFKRELRVVISILVIGYCTAVCFSFLFVYRMRHLLMSQYYEVIHNYPQQMLSCTDAFDEAFFGVKNGWYLVPKLDDIKECVNQAEANLRDEYLR